MATKLVKDRSRAEFQHGERAGRLGLRRRPNNRGAGLLPQNPLGGIRRARGFETNLTKAEASKRIDALKSKRELVQTDKSR